MAASKNMAQLHRGDGRNDSRYNSVGRRLLGGLHKIAAWVGDAIGSRHIVCHSSALAFSLAVVVPLVAIFGDRSLPFDYVRVYAKPDHVQAGQPATIAFITRPMRKDCDGEFYRYFTDAQGVRFFMGAHPVIYKRGLRESETGLTFEKPWAAPFGAALGPGLYESEVYFSCNFIQRLYPIQHTIKIPVTIIP